jgi:hypothetical protein
MVGSWLGSGFQPKTAPHSKNPVYHDHIWVLRFPSFGFNDLKSWMEIKLQFKNNCEV